MSRQDANAAFALSSFLQGTNATYIDEIYARYEKDPSSVDAEWQEFFKSLKDQPDDVRKNAQGPSWERANWPLTPQDDLTSALDGNWRGTSDGGSCNAPLEYLLTIENGFVDGSATDTTARGPVPNTHHGPPPAPTKRVSSRSIPFVPGVSRAYQRQA